MGMDSKKKIQDVKLNGKNEIEAILTRGNLVKIPFRSNNFVDETTGSTCFFQPTGITDNSDGSGTGIYVSVPQGLDVGVRIRFPFYGSVLGIRWRRDGAACDFSVAIDGVPYDGIKSTHTYLANEYGYFTDTESLVVIADDLPDGLHYAEIVVVSQPATTNTIAFYGYLVEERVGYTEKPRTNFVVSTASLTNSAVSITTGSGNTQARSVRKIFYTNTTASPITVNISNNGTVMWQKIVPANDTIDFDFGEQTSINLTYTHQASAVGVNSTVIGGY
jgi:hypothetical protein